MQQSLALFGTNEEIKCKKNANNLLLAPFFEAFIGGVSSAHGEEKVKKVSLRRDLEEKQRQK